MVFTYYNNLVNEVKTASMMDYGTKPISHREPVPSSDVIILDTVEQ